MTASITVGGSKLNSNGKERKYIITSHTHTHTNTIVKSPSAHLYKVEVTTSFDRYLHK
jgi:hypothetical protein